MTKLCTCCELTKEIDKFFSTNKCTDCRKEYMKMYKNKNKEKIQKTGKEYYQQNLATIKEKQDNYRKTHKTNAKEYKKEYYAKNKEMICNLTKKYKENNREKVIIANIKYRKENAEKITNSRRILRQKYSEDPRFRIMHNTQSRVRHYLKSNGQTKNIKTEELIGCNNQYLKEWLEYQFDDTMSWNNYGQYWHIDHVKPCNSYDATCHDDLKECFNWRNMRPLKGSENISKSSKIIPIDIFNQKIKVIQYTLKLQIPLVNSNISKEHG